MATPAAAALPPQPQALLPVEILHEIAYFCDYETAHKCRDTCNYLRKVVREADFRLHYFGPHAAWVWASWYGEVKDLERINTTGPDFSFMEGRLSKVDMALRLACMNKGAAVVRWALKNGASADAPIRPSPYRNSRRPYRRPNRSIYPQPYFAGEFFDALEAAPDVWHSAQRTIFTLKPIVQAVEGGHLETIKAFADFTSDFKLMSPRTDTSVPYSDDDEDDKNLPLQRAIELGHIDICDYLLNMVPSLTPGTLMLAARLRKMKLVQFLLQSRIIPKENLRGALVLAAANHDQGLMEVFQQAIGDGWNDETFFHQAIALFCPNSVKRLLPFFTDSAVLSGKFVAAVRALKFEIAYDILLHSKAQSHPIAIEELDPGCLLRYAATRPNPILHTILNKGIHPDVEPKHLPEPSKLLKLPEDYFLGTPLAVAAGRDQIECVELLLMHGADVNAENGLALCRAAKFNSGRAVAVLLRAGASVNSDLLFLAAAYEHRNERRDRCEHHHYHPMVTASLLDAGADAIGAMKEAIKQNSVCAVEALLEAVRVFKHQRDDNGIPGMNVRGPALKHLLAMPEDDSVSNHVRPWVEGFAPTERIGKINLPMEELIAEAVLQDRHEIAHDLMGVQEKSIDILVKDSSTLAALLTAADLRQNNSIREVLRLQHKSQAKRAARLLLEGKSAEDVLADREVGVGLQRRRPYYRDGYNRQYHRRGAFLEREKQSSQNYIPEPDREKIYPSSPSENEGSEDGDGREGTYRLGRSPLAPPLLRPPRRAVTQIHSERRRRSHSGSGRSRSSSDKGWVPYSGVSWEDWVTARRKKLSNRMYRKLGGDRNMKDGTEQEGRTLGRREPSHDPMATAEETYSTADRRERAFERRGSWDGETENESDFWESSAGEREGSVGTMESGSSEASVSPVRRRAHRRNRSRTEAVRPPAAVLPWEADPTIPTVRKVTGKRERTTTN
ncbi:hypothetical protein HDV00_009475 [Rhizophlyctis rosea]|nr:hypothetical protein HDV00_009475 [Rhizophlyctis rosea]